MSRYTGSRVKIIKKLNVTQLPGFKNTLVKKNVRRRKPIKQYKKRLMEKQKLRYYYGLNERQLVNYFIKAKSAEGSTAIRLLISLEMRLDNIIFRLGLAPSIPAARQLVSHGHVLVNKVKVHAPGYQCKPGDDINTQANLDPNRQKCRAITQQATHLKREENGGKVLGIARKKSLPFKINDLLVIEYYSK